jgi:hypothetical protein
MRIECRPARQEVRGHLGRAAGEGERQRGHLLPTRFDDNATVSNRPTDAKFEFGALAAVNDNGDGTIADRLRRGHQRHGVHGLSSNAEQRRLDRLIL